MFLSTFSFPTKLLFVRYAEKHGGVRQAVDHIVRRGKHTICMSDNKARIQTRTKIIWGHTVVQLVEALRYKSEGSGFNFRWCHWNFSLT